MGTPRLPQQPPQRNLVRLRLAKPAGILLFISLLISPLESHAPEADAETTRPAVSDTGAPMVGSTSSPAKEPPDPIDSEEREEREARSRMVRDQIEARGIEDPRVLAAMRKVPRHRFIPPPHTAQAYRDRPLRIGFDQTISQPYIVAAMTELAELEPGAKVLEVGTGSGYQAAVIHEIAGEVFSLEIVGELAERARATLALLGYAKAHVRHANGYLGWPEEAPFDAILVTAAPPEVPRALLEQLADGGRLVVPVGRGSQMLEVHSRKGSEFTRQSVFPVRFVPMVERARSGTDAPEAAR